MKRNSAPHIRSSIFTAFAGTLAAAITLFTIAPRAWTQNAWTNALSFDGVDDYVAVTNFGRVLPTHEVTVEFWQHVRQVKAQTTFNLDRDHATNRFLAHVPYSDGKVYWDFGDWTTSGRLSYTPPVSLMNAWHHFAFVARPGFMGIYRNGVLEASTNHSSTFSPGNHELRLGGTDPVFFGGELDEFRIWKVARSQAEIAADIGRPLTGSEPNLVAYADIRSSVAYAIRVPAGGFGGEFHDSACIVRSRVGGTEHAG